MCARARFPGRSRRYESAGSLALARRVARRSPNVERQANTEVVTALLSQGPTCVRCIARECSLSLAAAETVLTVIQRAFEVQRRETAECRKCGHFVVVFSLRR